MGTSMKDLADIPLSTLRNVRAVLTDIDDTLTLHGQLPAVAYAALERLRDAGISVIPITGRPAGWCDLIARLWPVDAVVGENGAFYFRYERQQKKMQRFYAQDEVNRRNNGRKLFEIADEVLRNFPGTAIASDQAYREIDVAIDFCEDVPPLPFATAQKIADYFVARGAVAKVSSIHVNAWFGEHDKQSMSFRLLSEMFGWSKEIAEKSVAYCGDSPNDAPMFACFPLGVGVANIVPLLPLMAHQPAYVTLEEGGLGFARFTDLLLAARR